MDTRKSKQIKRMTALGRFMYHTKAARFWYDGDSASFYLRWYHPIAWLFVLTLVPLEVMFTGLGQMRWYDVGIGVSPYWKTHKREYF